jgi:hypothetical protein
MESPSTPDEIRKILDRAEAAMQEGKSREQVCELLGISDEQFVTWGNKYILPPASTAKHLGNCSLLDAICPVFHLQGDNFNSMQQVGSGVLVRIADETFLLTAAHVLDHQANGHLFIPGSDGITSLYGYHAYTKPPGMTSREDDKGDIGYYKLPPPLREGLDPMLKPVGMDDLLLTDYLEDGDLFTFAGYPWRKSKKVKGKQSTEMTTYSGHAVTETEYKSLGYSRFVHIAIRLRLKKTFSIRYNSRQIAPHPQGISGGGVLSWPRSLKERIENPQLKLAGIGHTYHVKNNLMVATRVIDFLHAILKNNPELRQHIPELPL